ncbi:MAG TPA: DUF2268 domain-containing putative Zn-dependent protease [Caulobacteraceae bacterium]|jgi:hypothetical protein|nr:DUF2268 domain-containing putative Zn-dependent protease [Caulobacteraceae bacterium]
MRTTLIVTVLSCALACAAASAAPAPRKGDVEIQTEDVTRFFEVYDAAAGHPTAEQLQDDYIDPGTTGLHQVLKARPGVTAEHIAQTIEQHPELYVDARKCTAFLPNVRTRLNIVFRKLIELYPEAQKSPVTLYAGRGRPIAISGPGEGVQVDVVGFCSPLAVKFMGPNIENSFVYLIAHEYIHSQQNKALADDEHPTVLERSLIEGAAEFMGEMTSGGRTSGALYSEEVKGREKEIETKFVADEDKTDLSDWVDNTTPDKLGELGYWVGYRIMKSYYQHAPDKRRAIREIIQMSDPHAFLAKSGWRPGIVLE